MNPSLNMGLGVRSSELGGNHLKSQIEQQIAATLDALGISEDVRQAIVVERARDPTHGDFASNVALVLARSEKKKPRDLAAAILAALPVSEKIEKAEIAGPGFINFFLAPAAWQGELARILEAGADYGKCTTGAGRRVVVEFVSANPTGPLHVGHGRGAAIGDAVCRLLEASGWGVTREFYYNDAGAQINNLALSVQARCKGIGPEEEGWPADGYRGEYIKDVARAYLAGETVHADDREVTGAADENDLGAIRKFAVAYLRREQDADLHAFGVGFDVYSLESALYTEGKVKTVVARLTEAGHTYERDGALWLETTAFGDDKDRVMRKSDGHYTYFLPDVAYHLDKWERGFPQAINIQGSDHHSTVVRVRAGLQALNAGIPAGWPEYILHQMVTVLRNGTEVKISKRAGGYVTLRELIDEVGRDATRFFFVMRAASQHLDFDLDLAKSQSNDNPVYYLQYAHARIASVFRQLAEKNLPCEKERAAATLVHLTETLEIALVKQLVRFPAIVSTAAAERVPHTLAHYLGEVAQAFHTCYNAHTILVADKDLRNARLALIAATQSVIANGLALLGISAPERM
ncbi:MAG: arginine--tRNA ligase [Gammaproteobacteria bacterium]